MNRLPDTAVVPVVREHPEHDTDAGRVVEMDPRDPRWDEFVEKTPGALVFHHSGWLDALEEENGQRPIRLAFEERDGSLRGILPLAETRGLPFGIGGTGGERRLSSLPRTPVAGPVSTSDEALRALMIAAIRRARASRRRLQLRPAIPIHDSTRLGLEPTIWRESFIRLLPEDPERLRFGNSRNHGRIGWAVRRAEREGLRVRDAAGETDLRAWYRLYVDVNRWNGVPSRPYRFFRAVWRRLQRRGHMRLLLVEHQGAGQAQLVAGSILLMLGDTVFYGFNGRAQEALSMRPNDLLQWHAMREASAAGYRQYDFGEVPSGNDGLAAFKSKWGTETRQLVRYHAPGIPQAENGYAVLDSGGSLRQLGLKAWRRTPAALTEFAGDLVYRFL